MEHYLLRLQNATRKYWEKAALNSLGGESFTYGQMATQVEKFHLAFEALGLKKGDKVALCARNGARFGMVYMSVVTYGTVIVPILADFLPENVVHLTDHSDALVLFTNRDKFEKMDPKGMPKVRLVIDVDSWGVLYAADKETEAVYGTMEALFAKKYPGGFGPDDVNYPTDNLDELSTINYTSGSTGDPKGVMLTHRNFNTVVDYSQRHMPAGDKIVSMLPMAHMYGLVIEFIYPLCNGTAIYWLGKAPTPATLLKAFADVKPYLLVTVPLVMEKIYKSKIKPAVDKPSVKFLMHVPGVNKLIFKKIRTGLEQAFGGNVREFIMGGAALNPEVEKILSKIHFPYVVGYGMTEACPLLAYEGWRKFAPGSCGKALDCVEVRIDSDDPVNTVGEIQARGDSIMIGYYKNPDATKAAFTEDGWLRTGDLGVVDKEGNIFIRGRSKNMILSASGQNIYPEEVEAVVNNQPFVVESVVVEREGKLVALVYVDASYVADPEDLAEQIRIESNKHLPPYSLISRVELRQEPFEKTPKMSIKRFLYQ